MMGIPDRGEGEKRTENLFKERMTKSLKPKEENRHLHSEDQ